MIILLFFFFFNDTATTEIYTLSLHDALPISPHAQLRPPGPGGAVAPAWSGGLAGQSGALGSGPGEHEGPLRAWLCHGADRKSTRLNSSHSQISYAVFCLKKKKVNYRRQDRTR